MISFSKRTINICRSLLTTAHAPAQMRVLNSMTTNNCKKIVSFGDIWSVFHLTTHEKRKTDQNYKNKHTKHCITRHAFLE